MLDRLRNTLARERDAAYTLFRRYLSGGRPMLLRSDLVEGLERLCAEPSCAALRGSALWELFHRAQEACILAPWLFVAERVRIGSWRYLRFHTESLNVDETSVSEFLAVKERLATDRAPDEWALEIDFGPFNRDLPRLRESRSIGRGVEFLNRHLSNTLFQGLHRGDASLLRFLRLHEVGGAQLMLNDRIEDVGALRTAIQHADELLSKRPADQDVAELRQPLEEMGFEPGWGRNVARMRETLRLLSDILEAPDPDQLEEFLSRIPMIFSIVIITPHGYFGQSNVLGLPDTGGQVVYILDQVRALEEEMRRRLHEQGIDLAPKILVVTRLIPEARGTTCDAPTERVAGTCDAVILRVPFRDADGHVVPHWISRFQIWPYLERFALDAEREILAELGRRPALIIGNYSDGCLVASLLARRLHVTQCNIAHALEKTKYLHSDLYWRENEDKYHFSCQFTADLIAMNSADFIVTSTFQEIGGTEQAVGQYESYRTFTMPGMYRVVNGIDVFDPKFNIVSPGADPQVYFPHTERAARMTGLQHEIEALLFGGPQRAAARGEWADPDKPIVFTMARLDRIKNISGLVEWYARCARLRELANLLIVGGTLDPERSKDREEQEQIRLIHELFHQHSLDGATRWVGFQSERNFVGELYRVVADRRGVFVQPALFEAYGLTVVEAMSCGLPVFATCYGGPSEIIEHGRSGFHIDPNHGAAAAESIADFLASCAAEGGRWADVSRASVERIQSRYTWSLYARRLMTLSRVYGFWKYVSNLEREETRRYLDSLYSLQYRPLAAAVPS